NTPTGMILKEPIKINKKPREIKSNFTIKNANHNNLKNINVNIPKNILVSICGVSGSGKSSLMLGAFIERYPETIKVDQASIGISTRSTLATYMGIMDDIRSIFSKETGQPAGLFTFNSLGDRKSTRLNSSHVKISYAVFCLKKKKQRAAPIPADRCRRPSP